MSGNNNNPPKGIRASSSSFGNAGIPSNSIPAIPGFSQSQEQAQILVGFQGQFPLSQAHAIVQAQSKAQAQAQAHAQAVAHAHAQLQAHLQAQGLSLNQNQAGGLGVLSQSIATPGNASGKQIPLKPPIRPVGFSPPNNFSPLRPMELTPAARRKKQKLPKKQLQDKVAAVLPESALYTQLLEFESQVDSALARKKANIQEALKNPPCIQKTLRVYVFNTFANQIRTISKKPNAEPLTWTLKVVGRILEDGVDLGQPGVVQKSSPLYPKFSA